jgi:glutathione synthase
MTICFIIENWEYLKPSTNNTLRIVHEAYLRGHTVTLLSSQSLYVENHVVYGFFKVLLKTKSKIKDPESFHLKAAFEDDFLPLNTMDAIFVRKEPPIDILLLNFLDCVKNECFIINDLDGMRKANNKIYTSVFYDPDNKYLPKTYISKNKVYLRKKMDESSTDKFILKPLNGFGGSGVILLEKSASRNINSLLDYYIGTGHKRNFVIIQEYIESATEGDVRCLMLNGEILGAYKRVPADNEIRANLHAGGHAVKHDLTEAEIGICMFIGKKLVSDGLYFVGIDIIGEKLIEINVLSPGGIVNINRLNNVCLQRNIIDFIEQKVTEKMALKKNLL